MEPKQRAVSSYTCPQITFTPVLTSQQSNEWSAHTG